MDPKNNAHEPGEKTADPTDPTDLREANENIRKARGDEAISAPDPRRAGNKPAIDRAR